MTKQWLVDCDGVLGDFTGHVLRLTGATYKPEDIKKWDVFEYVGKHHEDFLLQSPEFWRTLPVIPGAQDAIKQLKQSGEVLIVTSPYYSCRGFFEARFEWLREHFGIDPGDVIPTPKKYLIPGDALFDDKPDHVKEWAEEHPEGTAYLFDQPYNRDFEWPHRLGWALGSPEDEENEEEEGSDEVRSEGSEGPGAGSEIPGSVDGAGPSKNLRS